MSWCRWGSPCASSMPQYECDTKCEKCPGSDLYIYDCGDGDEVKMCCCSCLFHPKGEDFFADENGMINHIEEHVSAGHHVRPSLRRNADRTMTPPWREIVEAAQAIEEKPA